MPSAARLEASRPETHRRRSKRAQLFLASLRKTASMLEAHIQAEERMQLLRDPSQASTSLAAHTLRRRLQAMRVIIQRVEAA